MKSIAKFLLAVFSFAPMTVCAAPISTTAGSNLTGYNGSMGSVAGNQWNSMTNPRQNTGSTAKADFGNCNALILRCATPKCSGGGCADINVAKSIVSGCVNSNATCKKYGDDLIEYIAAQLVSDSVAEANKQAAAAQAAAAASQASANQSAQQMAEMQRQMTQMQQENNAKLSALQNALEESQRAAADAIQQANTAPVSTSSGGDVTAGLTEAQSAAVKAGVDPDVVQRATITGQILTSMEGVDTSLERLKSNMRETFKYAGCNEVNGNNCTGPKRVKKFKDLALKFMEPYDALIDNLEDSLIKAQTVGVDMNDIYMMLSGSCNRWAQYLCRYDTSETVAYYCVKADGRTVYEKPVAGCAAGESERSMIVEQGLPTYNNGIYAGTCSVSDGNTTGNSVKGPLVHGGRDCVPGQVIPPEDLVTCTVNKIFDSVDGSIDDKIKEAWLNPDQSSTGMVRIGCASDVMNSSILKRRGGSNRSSNIDIDALELLIVQDAPNKPYGCMNDGKEKACEASDTVGFLGSLYCSVNYSNINKLKSATVSRKLTDFCCSEPMVADKCNSECDGENLAYVNPMYALCSVHAYNSNNKTNDMNMDEQQHMKEIIGLKSTVISQQLYKQYTMLEAMIKRLKIQLEKAALKADLQVASNAVGGSSSESDSGTDDLSFSSCSAVDEDQALGCLRDNYNKLQPLVNKGNKKSSVTNQLENDAYVLDSLLGSDIKNSSCSKSKLNTSKAMQDCLAQIAKKINELSRQINNRKQKENSRIGYGY